MLVGQNPGAEEARQGRPFAGRAGRYLDNVLRRNRLERAVVYITNIVKCRTPRNRRPSAGEVRACLPGLVAEINRVRPEIIVLMGGLARLTPRLENIRYIETVHPAAAMRFPVMRRRFEADFRRLAGPLP